MNFLTQAGKIFQKAYRITVDALFPLSDAEHELASLSPEQAYAKLPPAPPYDASVVPLSNTRSVFAYKDERVSKLVWSIKYKKSVHAVQIGGFALFKALMSSANVGKIIVVPIPITPRRRRERGYNQCELLLDEIQRLCKDNQDGEHNLFTFEKNLIERVQHKERQTLKSRGERLEGSKGIFSIKETPDIAPNDLIVVIDDVITTGSTMKEALDTLMSAGFSNVAGLSLAH